MTPLHFKLLGALGAALALALLIAWGFSWKADAKGWQGKFGVLAEQAGNVLAATRKASDNPELKWEHAAGQIVAMGESMAALRVAITEQNQALDDMAREAIRLRAKADELKAIADKAQAQRRAALTQLSDMAITPGTRDDCMALLEEAETALDLVREAGL